MRSGASKDVLWGEQEQQRRMRAAIIRLLKKHGPLTLRGLVARLKVAGLYRATHCARQLLPSGRVLTRRLIDPEKTRAAVRLLWLVPADVDREPGPDFDGGKPGRGRPFMPEGADDGLLCPPLKPITGVTPDDLAWQAYYRLPRAERRALPLPESGRGIAGWDGARTLDELRQGGLSEGEGRP